MLQKWPFVSSGLVGHDELTIDVGVALRADLGQGRWSQSLNGAPLRKAPSFFTKTGRWNGNSLFLDFAKRFLEGGGVLGCQHAVLPPTQHRGCAGKMGIFRSPIGITE
jgi:hypothetical protein